MRANDRGASFETIVMPHLSEALALARWMTGSPADAEDIVREACLRAFRSITSYAGGNPRARLLFRGRHVMAFVMKGTACAAIAFWLFSTLAYAQQDPGIRGGFQNTAGMLQYRGIPIPPPPVIGPHPTTGAAITANELASFKEGILRAGQLEAAAANVR